MRLVSRAGAAHSRDLGKRGGRRDAAADEPAWLVRVRSGANAERTTGEGR